MSALRDEIVDIYRRYNPAKIGNVEGLLLKYRGKEKKLLSALYKKYGVSARRSRGKRTMKTVSSTVPTGFFDDQEADARARRVDVEAVKDQKKREEWNAFMKFAESVNESEERSETLMKEEVVRGKVIGKLEQDRFQDRVARLKRMRKRSDASSAKDVEELGNDLHASSASKPTDKDATKTDLLSILRDRKRRRKEARAFSNVSAHLRPLDPLNWRSKHC